MKTHLIGDRGDWNRINSDLADKLNKEAELEGRKKPETPKTPEGNTQQQNTPIVDYDLSRVNPKQFLILPAKIHGTYSYPDTAVVSID